MGGYSYSHFAQFASPVEWFGSKRVSLRSLLAVKTPASLWANRSAASGDHQPSRPASPLKPVSEETPSRAIDLFTLICVLVQHPLADSLSRITAAAAAELNSRHRCTARQDNRKSGLFHKQDRLFNHTIKMLTLYITIIRSL